MNTLKKKQSQLEEVLVFPKNLFWSQNRKIMGTGISVYKNKQSLA